MVQNYKGGELAFVDYAGSKVPYINRLTGPDNLKTGVKSPCYYEPEINPTYDDLSIHYGFVVIPARVRKPRDNAKVETAVQVVERWVLVPLRKRTFSSIEEINEAIKPLLDNLNRRQIKHLKKVAVSSLTPSINRLLSLFPKGHTNMLKGRQPPLWKYFTWARGWPLI